MKNELQLAVLFILLLLTVIFGLMLYDDLTNTPTDTAPEPPILVDNHQAPSYEQQLQSLLAADSGRKKVYPKLSYDQTRHFLLRIEQLQAQDQQIDLADISATAQHSRDYHALKAEAIHIYGEDDSSNKYYSCITAPAFAQQLWELKRTAAGLSKQEVDYLQKFYARSYYKAKNSCLEKVRNRMYR